jgi:hypothetical protein
VKANLRVLARTPCKQDTITMILLGLSKNIAN